jgi:hypothetical protein
MEMGLATVARVADPGQWFPGRNALTRLYPHRPPLEVAQEEELIRGNLEDDLISAGIMTATESAGRHIRVAVECGIHRP